MGIHDMASSFVYRIPMLRSTVQTVSQKYSQVKRGNVFVHLVLSAVELCFYLCAKLLGQIQTYDYGKYLTQLNHYAYVFVCQYATPVLWSQVTDTYHLAKQFIMDAGHAFMKYIDHAICGFRGFESPHTTVNFDSPNMVTLIDLITRSLAELNIKENKTNSLLEVGGYEHEFHQSDVIVEHSSTSCHCDKHHDHQIYAHNNNNNNLDTLATIEFHQNQPGASKQDMDQMSTASCSSADDNIIAATYGKDDHDEVESRQQVDNFNIIQDVDDHQNYEVDNHMHLQDVEHEPPQTEDHRSEHQETPGQEWHKFYPSSQPLIPMMTEAKAFKLAEALREKRQDKTGRDTYEVDTVLVLLSQWNVIDEKSKHYAVDRANLLFLAICHGWCYALQKISPTTSAPIVTPSVTNHAGNSDHSPLQRHLSNEGIPSNGALSQAKRLRKNTISRSHSSVYSNDSGKHHPYNNYFHRSNEYNNNCYRRPFPPNMYQPHSHYNNGPFYAK